MTREMQGMDENPYKSPETVQQPRPSVFVPGRTGPSLVAILAIFTAVVFVAVLVRLLLGP